jgi:hypothetical protein
VSGEYSGSMGSRSMNSIRNEIASGSQ